MSNIPAGDVSVEYDSERELYRATFDSSSIGPIIAVTEVMADVCETDPLELEPLYYSIETDALEVLTDKYGPGQREGDSQIHFVYENHEVTVKSYGVIEVQPRSADSNTET